MRRTHPPAELTEDPAIVIDRARGPQDRTRLRLEVEGRRWAATHGIPTATVVAADPDGAWLASERIVDQPGEPASYVSAAIDAALRIQSAPPPAYLEHGVGWRPPRWGAPVRAARLAAAGVSPGLFVATRNGFRALPHNCTVHNDFHRGNVLNRAHEGTASESASTSPVAVIDWELITLGPRHHDAIQFIVDLADDTGALGALGVLLEMSPPSERPGIAAQLRWLALRTYASDLVGPRVDRDRQKVLRRRERWQAAQIWADEIGGAR